MTIKEIIDADVAKWEQKQEQHRIEEIDEDLEQQHSEGLPNEKVKTNIDSWRNSAIGEIFMNHFPELECFRPQLHKAANATEFKPFDDFVKKISASKTLRTAMQKMVEGKMAGGETGGP